ncbi:MAG: SH3 domain-containing protein [Lachnospiraceae bacterium]|nr:SH3 domain-containing protein [Lachnospiraceae bacterium]
MRNKNRMIQASMVGICLLLFVCYGWKENIKTTEDRNTECTTNEIADSQHFEVKQKGLKNNFTENISENEVTSISENDLETAVGSISENNVEVTKEEYEYDHLAFAHVDDYVNVRSEPSTDSAIVGKIFDGAVAEIISEAGENRDWYEIVSGNVTGYIKAEFFLRGREAADLMDKYIVLYGNVNVERLNVRSLPQEDSKKIGFLEQGDKVRILEEGDTWHKIQYKENQEGYTKAEYLNIGEEFSYAKTMEELEEIKKKEQKKAREEQELKMAQQTAETEGNAEAAGEEVPSLETEVIQANTSGTQAELRQQIIDYAMQYLGNKYISGGQSLEGGTDCSGFTCFVYADFGYSISRTPQGQFTGSGRSIDYSQIQPGDIICYSSNGGKSCTHVALYMGDGQIVHSANSRKGVITQNADYDRIIGVKNIID